MIKNQIKKSINKIQKEYCIKNILGVPKIEKIIINKGIHSSVVSQTEYFRFILSFISGQKATIKKSTKSIAGFNLRKDIPCSVFVTLRREKCFSFLERLIHLSLPRIKDFRGIEPTFDQHGSLTFAIEQQNTFIELNSRKWKEIVKEKKFQNISRDNNTQGFSITIVMKNSTKEKTISFLKELSFPFMKI